MEKTRRILLLLLLQVIPSGIGAQNLNQDLNAALIAATRKCDVTAVKTLLSKGADVNARTEYGATPLFYACDRGNTEIVIILLEHGADANAKDKFYSSTPIYWAVIRDHVDVVKLLLEKVPQSKEMVMEMAVSDGHLAIVKMLLETGGFSSESLTSHLTAAEKSKQPEVAEMLKKAGAKPRPKIEYTVDADTLKMYEGTFNNTELQLKLRVKEGKLVNGAGRVFTPISKHQFESDGKPPLNATFNLDGDKVVSLTVKFPGGEMVLKRVEAK